MSTLSYNEYYRYKNKPCCPQVVKREEKEYHCCEREENDDYNEYHDHHEHHGHHEYHNHRDECCKIPNRNLVKLIHPKMTPIDLCYFPVLGDKTGCNPPLFLDNTYRAPMEFLTGPLKRWRLRINCLDIDVENAIISNVADPSANQDVASKNYVDVNEGKRWYHHPAETDVNMAGYTIRNTRLVLQNLFNTSPEFMADSNTLVLTGDEVSTGTWEYQLFDGQEIEHFLISKLLPYCSYTLILRGPKQYGLSKLRCLGGGIQNVFVSWYGDVDLGPQKFVKLIIFFSKPDATSLPAYLVSMSSYN
jgi:hypothetical protein